MEITGIKDQICDVCHKMWQLGWVAANDGNVSVRLDDGTYLATPTGMSKSFITSDKLLRIDAAGNVLEGSEGLRPSSEIKMHLRCYEKREDVCAVVHAHPPAATGFAVAPAGPGRTPLFPAIGRRVPASEPRRSRSPAGTRR